MSTILLNYLFMLTLIFFFFCFSVLSPKIAYSTLLLYCFQGNNDGAWHCGSLMQIIVKLAVLQDSKSTAKWAFIKDAWQPQESKLPHICSLSFTIPHHLLASQRETQDTFYYPRFTERKNEDTKQLSAFIKSRGWCWTGA